MSRHGSNLMREPSDFVRACCEEIHRFRRDHREGPNEVLVSPHTYSQLQRALYADLRMEFRGMVDETSEGLRVAGVRIVADPYALYDRFYAVNRHDHSEFRYHALRMDAVVSSPRFQTAIADVASAPAPRAINHNRTLADMVRDYLPNTLFVDELSSYDTLLERVAQESAAFGSGAWHMEAFGPRVEGRPESFFKEMYPPWEKPTQRFKRSKESKNWERRMITSMTNLAKEFA